MKIDLSRMDAAHYLVRNDHCACNQIGIPNEKEGHSTIATGGECENRGKFYLMVNKPEMPMVAK